MRRIFITPGAADLACRIRRLCVWAGGNGVKIAEMMGAVPVGMPPGPTNEAMSKGTIGVSQFQRESVKACT